MTFSRLVPAVVWLAACTQPAPSQPAPQVDAQAAPDFATTDVLPTADVQPDASEPPPEVSAEADAGADADAAPELGVPDTFEDADLETTGPDATAPDAVLDPTEPDAGIDAAPDTAPDTAPPMCGSASDCDDGDACTDDVCEPTSGCSYPTVVCDDGNACTSDGCDATAGCVTTPKDCDDGIACTLDMCNADSGCSSAPLDSACDDGNPCTSDLCQPGSGCANTQVEVCLDDQPASAAQYVGIWQPASNQRLIYRDQTWGQLTTTWDQQNDAGYRLIDLEPRLTSNGNRYDSVYEQRTGAYGLYVSSSKEDFQAQQATWASMQLVDYETWTNGSGNQVQAGVWLGNGDDELHRDLSWDDLLATRTAMHDTGYRLVDLEVFEGDTTTYSALFHPGSASAYLWVGSRWERFAAKVAEIDNLKLVDVEVYGSPDKPRYAGVWLGSSGADRLVGGQPWSRFAAQDANHQATGLELVDLERFDGTPVTPVSWAASLYNQFADVAVGYGHALAKDGQIIGYGRYGDRRASWESSGAGADFSISTRTHLASVSKVITATAMVVAGIDFDAPFYPLLANQYPNPGAGISTVSIRELVTHTSNIDDLGLGGKRCGPDFDGTIANLVAADVLGAPGPYDYSNMNFCLARAVLEAVTGADYVSWVNANMFNPMGIYDFSAAPDSDDPTLYYKHDGTAVVEGAGYLWTTDYTSEAGAYGWYGSPVGLIRWLMGLRNYTVLTESETNTLFADNLGWANTSTSQGNADWHNGGWGTGDGRGLKTAVVRFPGGYDGVILINTRPNPAKDGLKTAFEALISAN